MKRRAMLPAALLLATALLLPAPRVWADKVDDLIRDQMQRQQIPGLTLAVIRDGKVVKKQGYGFADLENDVPATADTVYELASVSKQFTATAILMLVEEGKIGLDDPVSKHLEGTPEAWAGVTVRHLLTHTSGLPEFYFNPLRLSAERSVLPYTTAQQFADIAKLPLQFKPGEGFQYSNTGYELLGMIVEKVSGNAYEAFLKERIFTPLGMTETYFTDRDRVIKRRAAGYTLRNGERVNNSLSNMLGALTLNSFGGLLSSVNDLAKWDAALYTEKLLKKKTLEQMWTPAGPTDRRERPGLGWFISQVGGKRVIAHGGHTGTYIARVPEERFTLILLSNLGAGISPPFGRDRGYNIGELIRGIAGQYLPALAPTDTAPKAASASQ